jgi:hypothetical protein
VLYRGINIDLNSDMKQKHDTYETAFDVGTRITFPAPTSCTTSDVIAGEFTKGIQLVIQKASGVKLICGELSAFGEDEVMPSFPSSYTVIARSKVQDTVVIVIEAIPIAVSYCSLPQSLTVGSDAFQETFFDQELVSVQTKDSPRIHQYFCSFLLDRSSWKCILKLRKIKGGMKSLFLPPLPSKKHSGDYYIMGPESSFKVTKSSQFNFCITIRIPKATNQVEALVILGFNDSASFEKVHICIQMGLNRSARGCGGIGRYADPTLTWDHIVDQEDLFKSSFTVTWNFFFKRYGCLCSIESRRSAAQMEVDSYALCISIKSEMEQLFKAAGVKLERDIEILKSPSSMVTVRGPHIIWHLERLWYEKRCKNAAVIQRKFREQQLIKKLRALKDDVMDVKPRRTSSYLRPFRETHLDDFAAAQLQILLNLHAGWLGFGEVRDSLKILFAAPLEGVVAPCFGDSPFEWLSGHYLVIVPEFVLILGQKIPAEDAKLQKFLFQDAVPEIFVRQAIPISQIHEAVLSTFADDAIVRTVTEHQFFTLFCQLIMSQILKVSKSRSVPQNWGFPRRSDTSELSFCASCLSKFHIFNRRHTCPACNKVSTAAFFKFVCRLCVSRSSATLAAPLK